MLNQASQLISKHRDSGVYLDTNLMVVLVIGSCGVDKLKSHKRTLAYGPPEFRLLESLMSKFRRRLTTPNILTEVDNLARQFPAQEHESISLQTRRIVSTMFEVYQESGLHLGGEMHKKLGLTDAILVEQAERHLIITADFPLANRISTLGRDVINFNHLRRYVS
jgi:predicted nucleic acid-binding protein